MATGEEWLAKEVATWLAGGICALPIVCGCVQPKGMLERGTVAGPPPTPSVAQTPTAIAATSAAGSASAPTSAPAPAPASAPASVPATAPAPSYGPGYKWEDRAGDVVDAAAQMFSICLKWRRAGDTLSSYKLNKLRGIWKRQSTPDAVDAPRRQLLSSLLLGELLESWDAAEVKRGRDKTPQQDAARNRAVGELLASMRSCLEPQAVGSGADTDSWDPGRQLEAWRHENTAAYLRFIEAHTAAAQAIELRISPLKHVLSELPLRLPPPVCHPVQTLL